MTYDAVLAARVRVLVHSLAGVGAVAERPMFGGLSFLVHGRLAVAVSGTGGLLVPVGVDALPALVERDHVEPMTMGSRSSQSWVRVLPEALTADDDLSAWVERGVGATSPTGEQHLRMP